MRKVISMSGLLAGLIAAPGFAGPGAGKALGEEFAERPSSPSSILLPTRALTEEDRNRLQNNLLQLVEKGPHDIGGMMLLQQRMVAQMQNRLQGMQLAEGSNPPAVIQLPEIQITPAIAIGQATEKATFLGVTTSPVDPTLADQLQLPKGMGLVIDFIAKDSPAQAAGLQRHDVLTRLDDQLLVNMQQLAVLVRSKKPGDTVTLSAIRAGKAIELKAKLVEHDEPVNLMPEGFMGTIEWPAGGGIVVPANAQTQTTANPDGSSTLHFDNDKNHIAVTVDKSGISSVIVKDKDGKELYRGPLIADNDKTKITPEVAAILKDIHVEVATPNFGQITAASSTTIVKRSDANQNMTITIVDGHAKLVITDAKTGKETYSGNADTDDDFKKMPDGVAEKVRDLLTKIPPIK